MHIGGVGKGESEEVCDMEGWSDSQVVAEASVGSLLEIWSAAYHLSLLRRTRSREAVLGSMSLRTSRTS